MSGTAVWGSTARLGTFTTTRQSGPGMTEPGKFTTVNVSHQDCQLSREQTLLTIHVTGGKWTIGDIESDRGEVGEIKSVKKNERVWPSQVEAWEYYNDNQWLSEPQLSVTGTQ